MNKQQTIAHLIGLLDSKTPLDKVTKMQHALETASDYTLQNMEKVSSNLECNKPEVAWTARRVIAGLMEDLIRQPKK